MLFDYIVTIFILWLSDFLFVDPTCTLLLTFNLRVLDVVYATSF